MKLLTEWQKPNGVLVELNDNEATVNYARSMDWILFSETPEGIAEAEEILAERERRAEQTVETSKKKKGKPGRPAKKQDPESNTESDLE